MMAMAAARTNTISRAEPCSFGCWGQGGSRGTRADLGVCPTKVGVGPTELGVCPTTLVVWRKRRDESRRCRHDCLRHVSGVKRSEVMACLRGQDQGLLVFGGRIFHHRAAV